MQITVYHCEECFVYKRSVLLSILVHIFGLTESKYRLKFKGINRITKNKNKGRE